jgi:hypothetical protein
LLKSGRITAVPRLAAALLNDTGAWQLEEMPVAGRVPAPVGTAVERPAAASL